MEKECVFPMSKIEDVVVKRKKRHFEDGALPDDLDGKVLDQNTKSEEDTMAMAGFLNSVYLAERNLY